GTPLQNAVNYTDTGLSVFTTYFYRIIAWNGVGSSTSPVISIRTLDNLPPNSPTNLAATTVTSTTVALAWTAASDNPDPGAGVEGYRVLRDGSVIDFVTGFSYTAEGLAPVTTYVFSVSAVDRSGNVGPEVQLTATTLDTVPTAPTGLRVTAVYSSSATLRWNDVSGNETGFIVERSADNWANVTRENL
ncbi:MAG: fibronectin type III domain-containing protein, partial [Vicinamibacteria bacterium]|nr:fibronectin type III domain-containing protein [Vicinamibacteria bacterium]